MAAIDVSRETGGSTLLPPELSQEIWSKTQEASVVMRLGRQVPLPGSGKTIPIITGDAEADWVDETDEKPVSRATLGNKSMTPYKLAVIEPFSDEFRRDLPAVYRELARRLPNSIAVKFDSTVAGTVAPGSNFDTLGGSDSVNIGPHATDVKKGTWAGLIEADQKIGEADGVVTGWAVDAGGRSLFLSQVDSTGRPLLVPDVSAGGVGNLLGNPLLTTRRSLAPDDPNVVGFAGDWESAIWGTVEGIQIAASDTATIDDGTRTIGEGENAIEIPRNLNLWQRNMFALRVEIEVGFIVRDPAHFIKLSKSARS